MASGRSCVSVHTVTPLNLFSRNTAQLSTTTTTAAAAAVLNCDVSLVNVQIIECAFWCKMLTC